MIETVGRHSITDVFPKTKKRCGLYCFKKADGSYYIGQSADVVRRFAQHLKNHDSIECIWFQPIAKDGLDFAEKDLIFKAEKSGLPIINKSLVSNIIGDSDFDFLIDEQDQKNWLNMHHNVAFDEDRATIPEKYRIRYHSSFLSFKKLKNYGDLKWVLKTYIENCLPYPRKTEMSFWEVTCLPTTGASHHPRYFVVNIYWMELFVAGYMPKTN